MMIRHDTVASNEQVSPVFLAIWAFNDIPRSKISFTVPVNHFNFAPYCFCGKNLTCSFTFRTLSSLALWARLKCSFWLLWISSRHRQILGMLTGLWHRGMTAPCAGHPCSISAGDGRSFVIGVSRNCNRALAWEFGDPCLLVCSFHLLHHGLDESIWLMEMGWGCLVLEVKFSCKVLEFFTIEGWSIVGHHNRWYSFGRKQISQVSQRLLVVSWCDREDEWELGEIICNDQKFLSWVILKEIHTYFYPRSSWDFMWMQGFYWHLCIIDACHTPFDVVHHISFHSWPVHASSGQG